MAEKAHQLQTNAFASTANIGYTRSRFSWAGLITEKGDLDRPHRLFTSILRRFLRMPVSEFSELGFGPILDALETMALRLLIDYAGFSPNTPDYFLIF
jgi:hypothetical protein